MNKDKLLFGIDGLPNSLSHSGRPGMKWGVRNGPPYPLGVSNAKYKKMQSTEQGHDLSYKKGKRSVNLHKAANVASFVASHFSILPAISSGKKFINQNVHVSEKYKQKHDGEVKKLKDLNRKPISSAREDMKKVNPRGTLVSNGTYKNCAYCSVAMDMRRRGYDVRARVSDSGLTKQEIAKLYKGGEMKRVDIPERKKEKRREYMVKSIDKIGNTLEKQGPNARGVICIVYSDGFGGHAMFWENDSNSKLTIYDSQSKKINPNDVFALCNPQMTSYMRTDNLKPSEEITKYVTDKMS